jgi:hypothetical protein
MIVCRFVDGRHHGQCENGERQLISFLDSRASWHPGRSQRLFCCVAALCIYTVVMSLAGCVGASECSPLPHFMRLEESKLGWLIFFRVQILMNS